MGETDNTFADIPVNDLSLLEGIPLEKRTSVLRCVKARVTRFEKGDLLTDRSCKAPGTRYLVEGEALIARYDISGNRSILGHLREDTVITSDLAPVLYDPSAIDIVASKPCIALDFRITSEIEGCVCCLKHVNRIRNNLVAALSDMNMQLLKRLDTLANRTIRDKVLAYLQDVAFEKGTVSFTVPLSRQELADYLYVERSALSRELSAMQREGLISYNHNRFALL